jgi:hypothetical protein
MPRLRHAHNRTITLPNMLETSSPRTQSSTRSCRAFGQPRRRDLLTMRPTNPKRREMGNRPSLRQRLTRRLEAVPQGVQPDSPTHRVSAGHEPRQRGPVGEGEMSEFFETARRVRHSAAELAVSSGEMASMELQGLCGPHRASESHVWASTGLHYTPKVGRVFSFGPKIGLRPGLARGTRSVFRDPAPGCPICLGLRSRRTMSDLRR